MIYYIWAVFSNMEASPKIHLNATQSGPLEGLAFLVQLIYELGAKSLQFTANLYLDMFLMIFTATCLCFNLK